MTTCEKEKVTQQLNGSLLNLTDLLKTLYLVRKEREEGNLSITCLLAGDTKGVVSQSDLPLARHTLSQRRK